MRHQVEWYRPAGPAERKDKQFRLSDAGIKPDEFGNVRIYPVHAIVNEIPNGWTWHLCDKDGLTSVSGVQETRERAQWEAEQAHEARLTK